MSERTSQPPRRVLSLVRDHPWAMLRSAHETMLQVIGLRMQGIRRSEEEIRAVIEAARPQSIPVSAPGSIAVLPLTGILAQRMNMFIEVSGGTSTENFGALFRQALADPKVAAIIIMVDSPGGSVYGVEELGNLIYNSRGEKPVIAVANSMAASAAYWIASQADELVVTPGGEVGSIGVICLHENYAAMNEMMGVELTYLTYPEEGYKAEGNPDQPLSEETKAYVLGRLAEYGQPFEAAVARGRNVKLAKVQKEFGRGRMVGARTAVSLGMADRVATLQETIDRLAKRKARAGGSRAATSPAPVTAGPCEAPELREGTEDKSCANCMHYKKPSAQHDGGTCHRHDFHTMDVWLCDDWDMMEEPMEEDEMEEMEKKEAVTAESEIAAATSVEPSAPADVPLAAEAGAEEVKPEQPPSSLIEAELAAAKLRLAGIGRTA